MGLFRTLYAPAPSPRLLVYTLSVWQCLDRCQNTRCHRVARVGFEPTISRLSYGRPPSLGHRATKQSGRWGSNPRRQFGKLRQYHFATSAHSAAGRNRTCMGSPRLGLSQVCLPNFTTAASQHEREGLNLDSRFWRPMFCRLNYARLKGCGGRARTCHLLVQSQASCQLDHPALKKMATEGLI